MSEVTDEELADAVMDFFMAPVDLPHAPADISVGSIWWEDRGNGRLYPWRMTAPHAGYPCGEPRQKGEGEG